MLDASPLEMPILKMGFASSKPEADDRFLHTGCHKTYVVTSSHMDFIKIGYTRQPIMTGVWGIYRRAYGEDLEIIRVYPATHYKEDDRIHAQLHNNYGILEKGNEIYHKKYRKQLIRELDDWHEGLGVGPFKRVDILTMKQMERESKETPNVFVSDANSPPARQQRSTKKAQSAPQSRQSATDGPSSQKPTGEAKAGRSKKKVVAKK